MKQAGEILICRTGKGVPGIKVRRLRMIDQYQISELFQTDGTSIGRHIRNIYKSDELQEKATCAIFAQVQEEGDRKVKRQIKIYHLDMIISIGVTYDEAKRAIEELRKNFEGSKLSGNEKDDSFRSSIASVDQTFDGVDLYLNIEEKAADCGDGCPRLPLKSLN